ncbi:hypothetical protein ACRAWD_23365 [Caulobacter segnis]
MTIGRDTWRPSTWPATPVEGSVCAAAPRSEVMRRPWPRPWPATCG